MPKGVKGFQKGEVTNPKGRPNGAGDKNKRKIREWLDEYLTNNTLKLYTELEKLSGKDYVDSFVKLMEYGIPKLQRQTIEIDQDNIVRVFNEIPASALNGNGKAKDVEQKQE